MRQRKRRDPVRPLLIAVNFVKCNKKDCKSSECESHTGLEDVPLKREAVDFGNYTVGPSPPRAKPRIMKSPREMTAAEMEEHMTPHLPYADSSHTASLGNDVTITTVHQLPSANFH